MAFYTRADKPIASLAEAAKGSIGVQLPQAFRRMREIAAATEPAGLTMMGPDGKTKVTIKMLGSSSFGELFVSEAEMPLFIAVPSEGDDAKITGPGKGLRIVFKAAKP